MLYSQSDRNPVPDPPPRANIEAIETVITRNVGISTAKFDAFVQQQATGMQIQR
jgi:hypothetical protein